jgi:hypothetical protein
MASDSKYKISNKIRMIEQRNKILKVMNENKREKKYKKK